MFSGPQLMLNCKFFFFVEFIIITDLLNLTTFYYFLRFSMYKFKGILIIDDETELAEGLQELLSAKFDNVEYVDNSTEALKHLADNQYELIISDYKMPGLDGLALARKLRAEGNLTPIVWISGHCDKEMALKGIRLGVEDIVEKPFTIENLAQSIFRVLELKRRSAELQLLTSQSEIASAKKMIGLLFAADQRFNS